MFENIFPILLGLFILYGLHYINKVAVKYKEDGQGGPTSPSENFPFPEPTRHAPADEIGNTGERDDYTIERKMIEEYAAVKKQPQNKKDLYSLEKIGDFYAGTHMRPAVSELDNYESDLGTTENIYSGTRMRPTVSEFDNYTGEFGAKHDIAQNLKEAFANSRQEASSRIDIQDFDLRKAVIDSEILNAKYKEL